MPPIHSHTARTASTDMNEMLLNLINRTMHA